jgi:hypothetical protein
VCTRSDVTLMDDDLHDLFGNAPTRARDDEAAARVAVARAVAALGDPAARMRVLRWALERFAADADTDAAAPAAHTSTRPDAPAPRRRDDPSVAVDDLADLFEAPDELGEFSGKRGKSG